MTVGGSGTADVGVGSGSTCPIIRCTKENIAILDRGALEATACDCYGTVQDALNTCWVNPSDCLISDRRAAAMVLSILGKSVYALSQAGECHDRQLPIVFPRTR